MLDILESSFKEQKKHKIKRIFTSGRVKEKEDFVKSNYIKSIQEIISYIKKNEENPTAYDLLKIAVNGKILVHIYGNIDFLKVDILEKIHPMILNGILAINSVKEEFNIEIVDHNDLNKPHDDLVYLTNLVFYKIGYVFKKIDLKDNKDQIEFLFNWLNEQEQKTNEDLVLPSISGILDMVKFISFNDFIYQK